MKMTLKEAVLKSLEDINVITNYMAVFKHIKDKCYYDFGDAKTPSATISAVLGDFIRNNDTRVKRIKQDGGTYSYYLTKNEQNIEIGKTYTQVSKSIKDNKRKPYEERDLHKLLSTYLHSIDTYSKTIFHEQSNGKDNNQIWTHPDMVGIKFLKLRTKASQNFLKSINRIDTFKLSSYELKREIINDSELKKAFFQAVSNSSWANYGYLVAFEFGSDLNEEMARLNQSFGIGIIQLDANPFQSKVLYPAIFRELDFKTMDKLCNINKDFEKFIECTESLMTADEKYVSGAERDLDDICDHYFASDTEAENYCREKYIPTKQGEL